MKTKIKYEDLIRVYNKLSDKSEKRFVTFEDLGKPGILEILNKKPSMTIKVIRFCIRLFTHTILSITAILKVFYKVFIEILKLYRKYLFLK